VKNLVESGVKSIPASWVHKNWVFLFPRKMKPYWSSLTASTPSPVALSQRFRRIAALTTAAELSDPAQEALDNGRPVPEKIAAAMEKLIAPLVAALQDGLPDEAMDIIAGSYPDLDDSELVTLLEQALFVSDVWGRLNSDA
jgi:phage gp29-like protein